MPQWAPSRSNLIQFTASANYQKEPAINSSNKEVLESYLESVILRICYFGKVIETK